MVKNGMPIPVFLEGIRTQKEWALLNRLLSDSPLDAEVDPSINWKQILPNLVVTLMHQGKKVRISSGSSIIQLLIDDLAEYGLASLQVSGDDTAVQYTAKINQNLHGGNPIDDNHTMVQQWNHLVTTWSKHRGHAKKLMSEGVSHNSFQKIICEYHKLNGPFKASKLSGRLRNHIYEFSIPEYWQLRGRVKLGEQFAKENTSDFSDLDQLDIVFFDMYTASEAHSLLAEIIPSFIKRFEKISSDLIEWREGYKNEWIKYYREKLIQAQTALRHTYNRQQGTSKSKLKPAFLFGKNTSNNNQTLETSFEKIIHEISSLVPTPPDASDSIEQTILRWIACIDQTLPQVQKMCDEQLSKLNIHTTNKHISNAHGFAEINLELQSAIKDLNAKKVFKSEWHDNGLDIHSKIEQCDQWILTLKNIYSKLNRFDLYYQWKKFYESLNIPSQELIKALQILSPTNWIKQFDSWYLQHLILANPSIFHSTESRFGDGIKDYNKGFLQAAQIKAKSFFQKNWFRLLKANKEIKSKWQSGGPDFEHSELAAIFPIVLTPIEQLNSGESVKITIEPGDGQVSIDHQLYSSRPIDRNKSLPPDISQNCIWSSHSDRIKDVEALAQLLSESGQPFNLIQNNQKAILSFLDISMEKTIIHGLGNDFSTLRIKGQEDLEILGEALLNNRRNIEAYFQDSRLNCNTPHADLLQYEAIRGLMEWSGIHCFNIQSHLLFEYSTFIHFISQCQDVSLLQNDFDTPTSPTTVSEKTSIQF